MPADDRPGRKGVYIELPVEVLAEVRALAEQNGRDFRSEVEHALRRHLAAPPTVRVVVDTPLLDAVVLGEAGVGIVPGFLSPHPDDEGSELVAGVAEFAEAPASLIAASAAPADHKCEDRKPPRKRSAAKKK